MALFTSCNQARLSDARALYTRGAYHAAIRTYRTIYRDTPRDQYALRGVLSFEMAENYRRLNLSAHAVTAYGNAIRFHYPDSVIYLRYAQMLHREGNYPQAREAYRKYLQLRPGDRVALNGLQGVELAGQQNNPPSRYVVERMDLFNSSRGEFSPLLANGDKQLYITSSREEAVGESISAITGMKNNDLFVASKNRSGEWQKPEQITSGINTLSDEGSPSLSPDEEVIYYSYSPVDPAHATATQLYYSRKIRGQWSAGRPLQIDDVDSLALFAHPAVAPSGDHLYFVSDMEGGYGGKDLWRASISHTSQLMNVENAGPEINTPGDEMFPSLRDDSTLYFSSDGHPGMGGLDLFKATMQGDSWQVVHMQSPLNSPADDFGITFVRDDESGFFSSNREDARGHDHIYSFRYQPIKRVVEGMVVDQEDQFIPGAVVSVVGSDGTQQLFTTNREGTYLFEAAGGVDYLFLASADGFLNQKQSLSVSSVKRDTLYYVDFEMIPYDKPVILERILYDYDRATLRPESKDELDQLIRLLHEHPQLSIQLTAHTDRHGSEDYNRDLSLRRAQSVTAYLISAGIDERRLSAQGEGGSHPLRVNRKMAAQYPFLDEGDILTADFIELLDATEQEIADQMNRRSEFKLLSSTFIHP